MTPTTIGDLVSAFETLVSALIPTEAALQQRRWRLVDDIDTVPGAEIRTYYIDADHPFPVTDGIYSPSEIEHESTIRVWTSYSNIRRKEKVALAGPDALQIWLAWDIRRDPLTPGLVSVVHEGWDEEDSDQARLWGAHVFTVRFVAPTPGIT